MHHNSPAGSPSPDLPAACADSPSKTANANPATQNPAASPASGQAGSALVLIIAIVVVSINLRPALISVGPLVEVIRGSLGLSSASFGVLLTLPVLCFGVFAPFAPRLLRYWSAERIILLCLGLLAVGVAWRSAFGVFALFGGTLLAGLVISVVMVLLPSIIKHHFARHASLMMGLYTTAMASGAAVAAGATVPLSEALGGWRWALGIWVFPAIAGLLVWWVFGPAPRRIELGQKTQVPRLRSNRLAWQVTLYMGFQGAIAYSVFGWLPLILVDRGLSEREAGYMLAIMMFVQLWSSMAGPWIALRGRDQRPAVFLMLSLVLIGWFCFMYANVDYTLVWAIVFGLGFGGMFSLAMAFLVLRSPNPAVAAAISGMSQGVGYSLAAFAPLAIGVLHDLTHNWHMVSVFMVFLILGAFWTGLQSGRSRYIE